VVEALAAYGALRSSSLDEPVGADGEADTLGAVLGIEEDGYGSAEDRATLAVLMRGITPREREILHLRFTEELTQAEIGAIVGVSQMQVSRIIRGALARLREYAALREEAMAV
jgi:RNA polymerase sigma-B factor